VKRPARGHVDQPFVGQSLSSAFSTIFSFPRNPNSRAISRFPAGSLDDWMKASICSRLGRPSNWTFLVVMRLPHFGSHKNTKTQKMVYRSTSVLFHP
jgi:hypothetical protein